MILVRGWYRAATISDLIYSLDRNSFVKKKWNPLRQLWETTILLIGCQTFVCHLGNPIIQNPLYTILFKVTHLLLEYFIPYFGFKCLRIESASMYLKCWESTKTPKRLIHSLVFLHLHIYTRRSLFTRWEKSQKDCALSGRHILFCPNGPPLFLPHVKEFLESLFYLFNILKACCLGVKCWPE